MSLLPPLTFDQFVAKLPPETPLEDASEAYRLFLKRREAAALAWEKRALEGAGGPAVGNREAGQDYYDLARLRQIGRKRQVS